QQRLRDQQLVEQRERALPLALRREAARAHDARRRGLERDPVEQRERLVGPPEHELAAGGELERRGVGSLLREQRFQELERGPVLEPARARLRGGDARGRVGGRRRVLRGGGGQREDGERGEGGARAHRSTLPFPCSITIVPSTGGDSTFSTEPSVQRTSTRSTFVAAPSP